MTDEEEGLGENPGAGFRVTVRGRPTRDVKGGEARLCGQRREVLLRTSWK